MTQTIARIKKAGKHFEIVVDMDSALNFKKGQGVVSDFLEIDKIFKDSKKGELSPSSDMQEAFNTEDIEEIAKAIVKQGEIQTTQEHRSAEQEQKIKQVVDFLVNNAIDPQTKNPITAERIKTAMHEAHINVKNTPVENQIKEILEKLTTILPIKLETKKVKVTIPAIQTGKAYSIIATYKESENWLSNGDLEAILNIPAGLIMDFYDKINSATHGSALTEEIKGE